MAALIYVFPSYEMVYQQIPYSKGIHFNWTNKQSFPMVFHIMFTKSIKGLIWK
jgi:hypothetical protein